MKASRSSLKILYLPQSQFDAVWPGLGDNADVEVFPLRGEGEVLGARSRSADLATCLERAREVAGKGYHYVVGQANALAWLPVFRLAGIGVPFAVVPDFNHVLPNDSYRLALASQFRRAGDMLFTGSRSAQQAFARFGFECVPHLPTGIPWNEFRPATPRQRQDIRTRLRIPENATLLLYTGRLAPDKAVHDLIRAHGRIKQTISNSFLVVSTLYDHPEYSRKCQELAREVGDVLFVQDPPREDLVALYNTADLFALFGVSIHETFGRSPLEAMACGTVPVVPAYDGFAENIPESAGVLVPTHGDVATRACQIDEFAGAVTTLLRDGTRLSQMREACREQARRFDSAICLQRFTAYMAERAVTGDWPGPPAAWSNAHLPQELQDMAGHLEGKDTQDVDPGSPAWRHPSAGDVGGTTAQLPPTLVLQLLSGSIAPPLGRIEGQRYRLPTPCALASRETGLSLAQAGARCTQGRGWIPSYSRPTPFAAASSRCTWCARLLPGSVDARS